MKFSTVPENKKEEKEDCVYIDVRHKDGGKGMALNEGKGNGRKGTEGRWDGTKGDGGRKVEISIVESASVATTETTALTQIEPRKQLLETPHTSSYLQSKLILGSGFWF